MIIVHVQIHGQKCTNICANTWTEVYEYMCKYMKYMDRNVESVVQIQDRNVQLHVQIHGKKCTNTCIWWYAITEMSRKSILEEDVWLSVLFQMYHPHYPLYCEANISTHFHAVRAEHYWHIIIVSCHISRKESTYGSDNHNHVHGLDSAGREFWPKCGPLLKKVAQSKNQPKVIRFVYTKHIDLMHKRCWNKFLWNVT